MTLIKLKDYLQKQHSADLFTLTQHLKLEDDVVRDMLAHWMRKGKVRKVVKEGGCNQQCYGCDSAATEVYEWVD